MRLRTIGFAAALSVGLYQTSSAVVRPKGADAPSVSADRGPRMHRSVAFNKDTRLAHAGLAGWKAVWDQDTDVPLRMWGSGRFAAGSVADPAIAEAQARAFLAEHIATLAPGSAASDFELVSNVLSPHGDLRSVGFVQRAGGLRVVGGTIGFAFKGDRMAMVSSTALPHVSVTLPVGRLAETAVHHAAAAWLAEDGHAVTAEYAQSFLPVERVIVPVVRPRVGIAPDISYRVAEPVTVAQVDGPGRWNVWIDAADASPIVRQSTISYASGKVVFDVPDRGPLGVRHPQPASFDTFTVNGQPATAGLDGTVTWAGTANASIDMKLAGTFVTIVNKAGAVLTETLSLAPNGTLTWSQAANGPNDAQLDSYIFANQVKQFAKTRINPNLAWLNQKLTVNVNENQTCNAFSTGDDVHFFKAGQQCENTGRISDVVYHEFGHSLHNNSVIDGVGAFDGSLSEGLADTTAVLMTGDHGMGRGFFFNDEALRDLEPATPKHWPEDADGEPHDEGEIIGEALWDTRKALEAKLGQAAGFDHFIAVYYSVMQRATDIPSSFPEALLADDNDGDLTNGTPNQCEIQAAFGRHGLADPRATLGIGLPTRDNFHVALDATPPATACPGAATVQSVNVEWKLRGGSANGTVPLTAAGTSYAGDIPSAPDGSVVQYKVVVTLSDGSLMAFPQNAADPYYEFYVGPVKTLWCADFENGAADWTHGAASAAQDEWEVGAPMGLGGDPKVAHGGTNVFGIDLTKDGVYRPRSSSFAESPDIDLMGNTSVRLQYYRWLGVEDGFYDSAKISANGTPVWTNFKSATEPMQAEVNHIDREWRFQDVDLSAQAASGKIKLRFDLSSDEGFEAGGWTLDDVCVVAITGPALTCGNGTVDEGETCDDGNRTDGDGCSANCQDETGTGGKDGGGCCSAGGGPQGALALSALTFAVVLRRRRRR